jgi:methylenetetrahydrofolate dehydrogenase (NADP+) / methenyltetrahydrofolate cyclohydrolase
MSIVDGKAIATEIREEVAREIESSGQAPRLGIVACAPNFETVRYLELKEKIASTLGVTVDRFMLDETATTNEVVEAVKELALRTDGLVVQLPLPAHIDREVVLAAVPPGQDVDVFAYAGEVTEVLPPVVGAIAEIAKRTGVTWSGASVVIFGSGKLVGEPTAAFARAAGATVTVVTKDTESALAESWSQTADIIVLGAGKAGLLSKGMVKPGVVVFDAGASEDGGVLVGDADPKIAEIASVFTPVPGGIGPITIALLFRNLLKLSLRQ